MNSSKLHFVLQQGVTDARPEGCELLYSALMFQPRVIGVVVVLGLILQSWVLFLALALILLWNVLLPQLNLFDMAYNHLIARPRGLKALDSAPAPRRFAQGEASSFMLGIALALFFEWGVTAWILEGLLVLSLALLNFGRFCLGSYTYHLLHGNARFANHTLPWSHTGTAAR